LGVLIPTNIALTSSSIDENVLGNTTVGTLSTTDSDAGNTFNHTLVAGTRFLETLKAIENKDKKDIS